MVKESVYFRSFDVYDDTLSRYGEIEGTSLIQSATALYGKLGQTEQHLPFEIIHKLIFAYLQPRSIVDAIKDLNQNEVELYLKNHVRENHNLGNDILVQSIKKLSETVPENDFLEMLKFVVEKFGKFLNFKADPEDELCIYNFFENLLLYTRIDVPDFIIEKICYRIETCDMI